MSEWIAVAFGRPLPFRDLKKAKPVNLDDYPRVVRLSTGERLDVHDLLRRAIARRYEGRFGGLPTIDDPQHNERTSP